MGKFTLYSWPDSGNCYKVRLLCALLTVDYDIRNLDFMNFEHKSAEFKAINPKCEIPAMVQGDLTLTDSSSILIYIAATNADPGQTKTPSSYWSNDLLEQVQIIEWLCFANGPVKYGVCSARSILSYGGPYSGLGQNTGDAVLNKSRWEDTKIRGHVSLRIVDSELSKKEWLVGGRPTIADIANFVYISLAPMGDVYLDEYPHVVAWIERIQKLPGFITFPGMEDPMFRRQGKSVDQILSGK